jgi:hypothetical protein
VTAAAATTTQRQQQQPLPLLGTELLVACGVVSEAVARLREVALEALERVQWMVDCDATLASEVSHFVMQYTAGCLLVVCA